MIHYVAPLDELEEIIIRSDHNDEKDIDKFEGGACAFKRNAASDGIYF